MTPGHHVNDGEQREERPVPETPESRRSRFVGIGIALGTSLGLVSGLLFGLLLLDNFVFALPIGLCLGVVIGAAVGSQRAAAAEQAETGEGPDNGRGAPERL